MNECCEQTYPYFYLHALVCLEQGAMPIFNVDTDEVLRYNAVAIDEVFRAELRQLPQREYERVVVQLLKSVYEMQEEP